MRALRLESVGNLFVREVDKPAPGPDDLLVRVEACGICGTDRHLFLGEFPSRPPVTIGHEFAGIVEAVGSDVTGFKPGDRVTGDPNIACGRCPQCAAGRINLCRELVAVGIHRDGGMADYVLLPQKQAFALPANLDPLHGAFCEPLACCLHGIDIAGIRTGSSVVVLGGGVIGLLVVQLARLAGATSVILSTRQAAKRRLAEELGATATIDPSSADIIDGVAGPAGLMPGGADVVIECAGVPDTMAQATKLASAGGTVVILGVMPQGAKLEIEPFDILFRELRVLGSFLNPFTHRRAAELIASGAVKVDKLISRTISLDKAPDVIGQPAATGEIRVLIVP
jgi:2-desacetyl-2-hydroxyethyl bacteriochlorophyllide A dehydrogenase